MSNPASTFAEAYPNSLDPLQLQQLSPAALAYIGDAVYELYIRTRYLMPPKRLRVYHQQVVSQVRAETQAEQLALLQPYLSEAEQTLVRRGRNAASGRPKRVAAEVYQQATALEALLGYLYLCDPQRLKQLLSQLQESAVESTQSAT
ncbi:MAG: Mini-ribonuclease 3 [Pegethrix bostrychoides GSE-TBD4-15B]|jgi:ribonuclease-3 family protein|uniref:Mini-ribonuclease 3 n=1 Tax=Pegethrix bostrychoides GSE-TBD4-15B TaxID=2839662 RepID=A0A951PDZ4_9CYAN|nr:Mini-ribonuclease 3 [Pegethrix bostrychoides GSE-TBD4-15B]